MSGAKGRFTLVFLVLAASLALRIFLFQFKGYKIDDGSFTAWFRIAVDKGLYGFYDPPNWSDYPPLNIYIFWAFGNMAKVVGQSSLPLFLKLPANLFDIGVALMIYLFLRQKFSFKASLGMMSVYAFNPATIFNAAVWGQMDAIYTLFMVGCLIALVKSKFELSGALMSLAILTKPQTVVLLPVVAYVMLRNGGWRRTAYSGAVFWALIFLVILPFHWDNPVRFLVERYAGYGVYPYNSINAYNFWALLGFWKPDTQTVLGLSYQIWGVVAFVIFMGAVIWLLSKRYSAAAAIFAVCLLLFGFFMLMTRMHERYLFPSFALLALGFSPGLFQLTSTYIRVPWLYTGLIVTYLFNMAYILPILNSDRFVPDGDWSFYVVVPINAVLFIGAIVAYCRMQRGESGEKERLDVRT